MVKTATQIEQIKQMAVARQHKVPTNRQPK